MSEAPTVFCPKDKKKVPIWFCTGSFTQKRKACHHTLEATVSANHAEVKCDYKPMKCPCCKQGMTETQPGVFYCQSGHEGCKIAYIILVGARVKVVDMDE